MIMLRWIAAIAYSAIQLAGADGGEERGTVCYTNREIEALFEDLKSKRVESEAGEQNVYEASEVVELAPLVVLGGSSTLRDLDGSRLGREQMLSRIKELDGELVNELSMVERMDKDFWSGRYDVTRNADAGEIGTFDLSAVADSLWRWMGKKKDKR